MDRLKEEHLVKKNGSGGGPVLLLVAGAGLFGKLLVNVAKIGVLLTAKTFSSRAWPILRGTCLLQLQPLRNQLPKPVKRLTSSFQPFSAPMLAISLSAPLVQYFCPDLWRTLRYWRRLLPIYAGYMKTKYAVRGKPREERDQIWAVRHEWGGEKVYQMTLEMSGFYVKSAQVLASKSDFMPEPWTRRLSTLFDSAPPRPFAEVSRSIREQLALTPYNSNLSSGKNGLPQLSSAFLEVDSTALAAASIAQVHTAQLLDGTPVVIKVQHLGMRNLMDSDLRNIGRVAKFLKSQLPFDLSAIVQEIQTTIPKEFDFNREVAFMTKIKESLEKNVTEEVVCPYPFTELCAEQMIVMQRLEGVPFTKILSPSGDPFLQEKAGKALSGLLKAYGQMLLVDGIFHADPHPGNLLLMPNGCIALLDYGQSKVLLEGTRLKFARLVLALAGENEEEIGEALTAAGMTFGSDDFSKVDNSILAKLAYIMFDTRPLPEAHVSPMAADSLLQTNPLTAFNQDFWLVVRTVLLLRGLCNSLQLDISAAVVWQPYAQKSLQNPPKDDKTAKDFLSHLNQLNHIPKGVVGGEKCVCHVVDIVT